MLDEPHTKPHQREVHEGDALPWLKERGTLAGASIVTSLPDATEVPGMGRANWSEWFVDAAEACARAADEDGLAIFYQTDAKLDGQWFDKAAMVRDGALRAGLRCVFHRIVLRAPPGALTQSRAGYSHLVGFSRKSQLDLSKPMADVLADAGPSTWTRGMGIHACRAACEAVIAFTPTRTIVDPFCGHGTVLAIANALGLRAVGVELGHRRARRARNLRADSLSEQTDSPLPALAEVTPGR